jgi:hypothetical protein
MNEPVMYSIIAGHTFVCGIGAAGEGFTEHTAAAFALLPDRHFSAVLKDKI